MKLCYVDCETTGFTAGWHEAYQIAVLVDVTPCSMGSNGPIPESELYHETDLYLRPDHPERCSEDALRISGKTLAELAAYPERRETYLQLCALLAKYINKYDKHDKFVWVGQNARFDMEFVRDLFALQGDKYFGSWFYSQPVDLISLAVAMQIRGHVQPENFKLESLCKCVNVPLTAHDALNDIRATRAVFRKLMHIIPQKDASHAERPVATTSM